MNQLFEQGILHDEHGKEIGHINKKEKQYTLCFNDGEEEINIPLYLTEKYEATMWLKALAIMIMDTYYSNKKFNEMDDELRGELDE